MLTPTKPVKSCECGGSCGGCCCCTKESIGLGNVDNTSDLNKPLSTDMVNALSGKVDLDVFTQLKNRVLALENSIPDITSLENRMTNAEANIVTLQSNYANLSQAISNLTSTVNTLSTRVTGVNDALVTVDTRVDALEDKDINNVKLSGVSEQTVQGTLKANDPASGATDKTLVTANWISQTGSGKPNNLIHDSGNEEILGTKTFVNAQILKSVSSYYRNTDTKNGWIEIYNFKDNVTSFLIEIMGNSNNNVGYYSKLFVTAINPTTGWITFIDSAYQNTNQRIEVLLTHDGTKYAIWCKFVSYRYANVSIVRSGRYGTEADTNLITINGTDHGATKPTDTDYTIIADEVNQ